jgi:hypothetical protein
MPISHSVELVDAATALQWLEHNKRNRPVSNATVARYRRAVEAWEKDFGSDFGAGAR